jgi:hypothetical protein
LFEKKFKFQKDLIASVQISQIFRLERFGCEVNLQVLAKGSKNSMRSKSFFPLSQIKSWEVIQSEINIKQQIRARQG